MQQAKLNQLVKLDFRAEEALKALRSNIQFCGEKIQCIAFTSDAPCEGKSSITFQLALSFAEFGKKVILLDTDIRKSVLKTRHDMSGIRYGLSHLLSGQVSLEDCIAETNIKGFDLIATEVNAPNPSELLGSKKFKEVLEKLRETYDYVIVDTPPIGSVIDAAIVGQLCDGIVLVMEENRVSRQAALAMKEQLEHAQCKILGVVLSKVSLQNRKSSYYKKYENYYAESGSHSSKQRMKKKLEKGKCIVALGMLIVTVCVGAFVVNVRAKQDRVAPQIIVENEQDLILYDGVDEANLLRGIQAIDEVDGDVSDSLIVQTIYNIEEDMGVAVIVAKDRSNNISTIDRKFVFQEIDENAQSQGNEQNISDGESETEPTQEETQEEQMNSSEEVQNTISEEEYDQIREENLAAGIPFIRMIQNTITVSVGQSVAFSGAAVNIADYIAEVVDDKDNAGNYIHLDGSVDSNVVGTYVLQIYVVDSDGNKSNVEEFTVIVQ